MHDHWSHPGPGVSVRWERDTGTGEWVPVELRMSGRVTSERLRALRVSDWSPGGDEPMFVLTFAKPAAMSTADYAALIARAYESAAFHYPGRATARIAETTGMPFTAAVHWVRQARRLGMLPLSARQRARVLRYSA